MSTNPLLKYYRNRVAGLHINLPSGGNYGGAIEFNMTNMVEVYALTAADEIYITNPDALISGASIERIVTSCCPAIKDVKNLPIQDVDTICLASKKLSYGPNIIIKGKCSECGHEQDFNINIDYIFSKSKKLPTEMVCEVDGLKIYLRPYSLEIANYIAAKEFEENKLIEYIQNSDITENDKTTQFFSSLEKIQILNLNTNQECIIRIKLPDGEDVVDKTFIKEFIENAPLKTTKAIINKIKEFNEYGLPKEITSPCSECSHEEILPLIYDPTSFFD